MKKWSYLFAALALLLSHVMCATVAYRYRDMLCGIRHSGYSAPAGVALLSALPFTAGIALCVILAVYFHRKCKRKTALGCGESPTLDLQGGYENE